MASKERVDKLVADMEAARKGDELVHAILRAIGLGPDLWDCKQLRLDDEV